MSRNVFLEILFPKKFRFFSMRNRNILTQIQIGVANYFTGQIISGFFEFFFFGKIFFSSFTQKYFCNPKPQSIAWFPIPIENRIQLLSAVFYIMQIYWDFTGVFHFWSDPGIINHSKFGVKIFPSKNSAKIFY